MTTITPLAQAARSRNADIANKPSSVVAPRSIERLKNHYEHLILGAGEDLNREGLVKTPERAAKAWQFLTSGYDQDPPQIIPLRDTS